MNNIPLSLLEQTFMQKIKKYWDTNKIPFVSCNVFGFLAYMYFFTNKITNYDDIHYLFGKGGSLDLGRWGLDLLSYVLPDVSLPWLWGVLTIFIFSITICMIIDIMQISNTVLKVVLTGITVTFASETDIMLFMYTAPCYSIAFFLSVFSVKCIVSFSKSNRRINIIAAVVFEVIAIGIYQAYVLISSGLLILLLIREIFSDNFYVLKLIKKSCTYLLLIVFSMGLYAMVLLLLQKISHVELSHYASSSFTYNTDSIPVRIRHAYSVFIRILFLGKYGLIRTPITKAANIIAVVFPLISGLSFISDLRGNKTEKFLRISAFIFLSIIVLPLNINGMFLLVASGKMHSIVLFSFNIEYIFAVSVVDMLDKNRTDDRLISKSVPLISILLSVCIIDNIFFANKTALRQYMEYENTYSLYQSVITQIQMMPEFDSDCKLAIIGEVPQNTYKALFKDDDQNNIFGVSNFRNDYSRADFIQYYLGFDVDFATKEEQIAINNMDEFKSMPIYPYYGYINRIDDFIVVKFSDFIDR